MFTGIVEEIGNIVGIRKGAKSARVMIEGNRIFEDMNLGDSIAVNGVCLTVNKFYGRIFEADVMNETLQRTNLGEFQVGSKVNLERAMNANGRFGGHIVSGHIDGTGIIVTQKKEENAIWLTIKTFPKLLRYIVEKGSIAIDGISLTVAKVEKETFSVSLIPHTAKETSLLDKSLGQKVNLENDIIGKYVERILEQNKENNPIEKSESRLTMEYLSAHGF